MKRRKTVRTPSESVIKDFEVEINTRLAQLRLATTAEIRNVRREFSKRLAGSPPELLKQLALRLIQNESPVPRFFAYELLLHHKPALSSIDAKTLEQLGQGIQSWVDVDTFACFVAGPVWREHQVAEALIKRWATSSNRWWRRAAVVSTVPLNSKARGGSGDTTRTLLICKLVINDRDDMVVKALSWALRELSKRDTKTVQQFLLSHEGSIAPRVLREVSNKLSTGLKNPRKAHAS